MTVAVMAEVTPLPGCFGGRGGFGDLTGLGFSFFGLAFSGAGGATTSMTELGEAVFWVAGSVAIGGSCILASIVSRKHKLFEGVL